MNKRKKMKRVLLTLILVLAIPSISWSQATTVSRLALDQDAPDLATANSYTYKYYPNNAAIGIVLLFTCTGTSSPFLCTASFPAFTPGAHTLTVTASNIAGESPKSGILSFTFVIIPSVPTNLRIQ